ncbi:DCN1-like protein 2, partial [Galemys pyrenaicus]
SKGINKLSHLRRTGLPCPAFAQAGEGLPRAAECNLNLASISILVIAWNFRAITRCEFSKMGFVDSMTELGYNSTDKLKALLRLEQEAGKNPAKFKDFCQFIFTFAKDPGAESFALLLNLLLILSL